ncbi:SapC family protein [Hyphomonas johnsonii]|uniref:SapC family protein n=1 Tax=Hyphomonas johnsonii MHS-2 TaxID=1280950 RepID=A0A059FRQ5_9PROT|nr:SapC family protein [Hyphomonas johnsonii]KCZ93355.1 SapC family protein [Hyphomonas johnsonii MHS-2]
MTNTVLLNNIDHQDLKVLTGHGTDYGDQLNQTVVFPTEYAEVQREYPILFRKDDAGAFYSVALLGLDKGENLFLDESGWQGRYVPAIHQRGPFIIGFQDQEIDGETRREPVIYVDLDNPRVSRTQGQPLFLKHGGNTPYLQHVSHVLRVINKGAEIAAPMFAAFEQADLIEPASLDIRLDEHTVYTVPDVYSINEDKLAALEGPALTSLHRAGYLRAAYLVLASLPNVSRLIALKNARRATGA